MTRWMLLLGLALGFSAAAAPAFRDSFENDGSEWNVDGRYWQLSGRAAHEKQALMRTLYPGGKKNAPAIRNARKNAIPLPGEKFRLSIQAQLAPVTPGVQLKLLLDYRNAAGQTCGSATLDLTTNSSNYTGNSFHLVAPAGAVAVLPEIQIHALQPVAELTYIRFDDLVIEDAAAANVAVPGKPIRIILPAAADRIAEVTADVPGTFPVKGGQQIHLSYCAKGGVRDTTVRSSLEVTWLDRAGQEIGTFATRPEPPGFTLPYRNAAIADAPADAVSAKLTIRFRSTRPQTQDVQADFSEFAVRQWLELLAEKKHAHQQFKDTSKPIVMDPETKGKWTTGNLSIGKFYRFSRQPRNTFGDSGAGLFTDGTRLTDGIFSESNQFQNDRSVTFAAGKPLAITLDLGAPQLMQRVEISHVLSGHGNLVLPENVTVTYRADKAGEWKTWKKLNLPKLSSGDGQVVTSVMGPGVMAAEIMISFPATETTRQSLSFDEITVKGRIKNTWKYVPSKGAYHGAFTPTYGFKEPLRGGNKKSMSLQTYEKVVGKACSMVLWYQGMSPERRFTELAELRNNELAENHRGFRYLCVGWLPPETTKLADIASGVYDEYFAQYFRDSIDPALNLDNDTPVWFRPMNEFNSDWVNWGLDPAAFRKAWRRIFNIAEQVGATKQHIFVWSVNHLSYPNTEWNNMRNYYPGDQYVDWVGLSCYSGSLKYVGTVEEQLPAARAREVNEYYGHYKPMMVTEGGYGADQDREGFVSQWFDFQTLLPNFKAMIWENHNDRCVQDVPTALEIYRKKVQSPYWIDNNTIAK